MKLGVLCSGVALGVYIPGLYVCRDAKKGGLDAEVYVLENYLDDIKKSKINQNKQAFHSNFKVAMLGQKIAGDIMESIDTTKLDELFYNWNRQKVGYFLVLSGFWLSIIEIYQEKYPQNKIIIENLHIDSDYSPSWKKVKYNPQEYIESWLISYSQMKVIHSMRVASRELLDFNQRDNRLLIHGGGWGMGTYQSKIPALKEHGIGLDIVAYYSCEITFDEHDTRYFMIDPDWSPWMKNSDGEHHFPPFSEIKNDTEPTFKYNQEYPELFDISRSVKAIVSKPGGSTLLDSFAGTTPVVLLEPFGEHEEKNARLWKELGFGIDYDDWEKAVFDFEILNNLNNNLIKAQNRELDYTNNFIQKNKGILSCSQKPM